MSPPRDRELRRTDHTHGDARVGNPDRGLGAQLIVYVVDVIEGLQKIQNI